MTLHTETITHNGRDYTVTVEQDDCIGAPWKEYDGHGPVRECRTRHASRDGSKRPGERPLNDPDRFGCQYYYDWAGAMRIAKRDGWRISTDAQTALTARLGRAPTPGEIRAEAVRLDFQHLRGWLDDDWCWSVVTVECGAFCASLGGVAYGWRSESWRDAARDLIEQVECDVLQATETAQGRLCDARGAMRAALRSLDSCVGCPPDVYDTLIYAMRAAHRRGVAAVAELRGLRAQP